MIAAGLTLLAFFALAAAMPRHAPVLLGPRHGRVRLPVLRLAGWALLLAALTATLLAPNWPVALVTWFGLLPFAAAVTLLGLTYDARLARGAAALGAAAIVAGIAW